MYKRAVYWDELAATSRPIRSCGAKVDFFQRFKLYPLLSTKGRLVYYGSCAKEELVRFPETTRERVSRKCKGKRIKKMIFWCGGTGGDVYVFKGKVAPHMRPLGVRLPKRLSLGLLYLSVCVCVCVHSPLSTASNRATAGERSGRRGTAEHAWSESNIFGGSDYNMYMCGAARLRHDREKIKRITYKIINNGGRVVNNIVHGIWIGSGVARGVARGGCNRKKIEIPK